MSEAAASPSHDGRASTVMDDEELSLSRTYAHAFLNVADREAGQGGIDALLDEYDEFLDDVIRANPRFAEVLRSPLAPTEEKDRILAQILEGRASSTLTRFLRVLNRNNRLGLTESIAREARETWEKRCGRTRVTITSARPLDQNESDQARDAATRLFGGTPTPSFRVDPELIGGLVVQSGDIIYDMSVRNQLRRLHVRLLEQKNHEIQNRRDRFSHHE